MGIPKNMTAEISIKLSPTQTENIKDMNSEDRFYGNYEPPV